MFGLIRPALSLAGARSVVHFQIEPNRSEIEWVLKAPPAHIVTCARYIANQVRGEVERQQLSTVVTAVPNAVDLDRFSSGDRAAARLATATPLDRFVILMLANLAPHKGQATAIRALEVLARRGIPAELWVAGEDRSGEKKYERHLRDLATGLNVGAQVRFLGFRPDVLQLLRASDAFVLPSTNEGLPLSILEAQACGIPVIASDIPGVREIIEDGATGFIVPADHPHGYSERLLALYRNRELAADVADAGLRRIRTEYSWETFEERMFAVYIDVASSS
jgi:glycosyltransferase involved in cell wall biosynthesis